MIKIVIKDKNLLLLKKLYFILQNLHKLAYKIWKSMLKIRNIV